MFRKRKPFTNEIISGTLQIYAVSVGVVLVMMRILCILIEWEVVVKALRLAYTSHFSQTIDSEVSHLI